MTRFRFVLPALSLAILTVMLATPVAQAATACGCEDVRDLRNRICEARAASAEYGRQVNRITQYERDVLKAPLIYTEELYKGRMQPCIQEAINTVTDTGARRPTAETNNACEITLKGNPTACMAEALKNHERYHVRACMQRKEIRAGGSEFKAWLGDIVGDSRAGQSLASMANEERSAYAGEIEFNLGQLRSLAESCPKGMFEITRNGRREFTIDYCPAPRPRPAAEDSGCPRASPPSAAPAAAPSGGGFSVGGG